MKKLHDMMDRLEDIAFVQAIRRGLVMTIPLLMIGSFALILRIMPIEAYQAFLQGPVGIHLYNLLFVINQVTFGVLSLCITISVSVSYTRIRQNQTAVIIGACFAALCSYAVFIGLFTDHFDVNSLGAQGMFTGLFCAILGSELYCRLVRTGWFSFSKMYTIGADVDFNNIVSVIMPVGIVVFSAYLINITIAGVFNVNGFEALFHTALNRLFDLIENTSLKALLFVFLINLLWFFGIHGTNVLDNVARNIFYTEMAEVSGQVNNQILVGFLTKPVIDVFVLMGGCGTTISLLVAILLFGKKKNNRSLAKMASIPMLFNVNELMVFGLPIVFNATFFIPFLLVPLVCIGTTALALTVGLIPQPESVSWVMPIFVNGYLATGTLMGSVVQLVNIIIGAFIYRAFLLRYEKRTNDRMMKNMDELVGQMKQAENTGETLVLLELKGGVGSLTKMLAADLAHVLKEPESLQLYYQPQYDEKDQCIGAEALLRWNHPLCGMIYPPLLIGIAAETGLLGELERTVFNIAAADIVVMQQRGVCPGKISVNATAATLSDPSFVDFLRSLQEVYPEMKGLLTVELTEQMSFMLTGQMEQRLGQIRDMGIHFAVDDFSMGHTSVKYLQSNLFDIVKLDGSLVTNMVDNERSVEIIWSIINMSKTMGFKVLAEYVETVEQRDMLREMGCYLYQGWLFSPAVPLEKFIERISSETK